MKTEESNMEEVTRVKVSKNKETMQQEFRSKAMFDNYAEHTLKAVNEVRFYKRLKSFWFLTTTVLCYVWIRAYFFDKSYRNDC